MKTHKKILDACCGGRMFWFDKTNHSVLFADIRKERLTFKDKDKIRSIEINPDIQIDFRKMPFADLTFKLVVFDPPHLHTLGANSWMAKKYGRLNKQTWQSDIKNGFDECMRVLDKFGILIFKWNESEIKTSELLKVIQYKPLFGHTAGRQSKTIWMAFMKM